MQLHSGKSPTTPTTDPRTAVNPVIQLNTVVESMLWHESDVRGFVPMSVASHVPAVRSPQRQLHLAGLPGASALPH